jgi:hypothetical protein
MTFIIWTTSARVGLRGLDKAAPACDAAVPLPFAVAASATTMNASEMVAVRHVTSSGGES